MGRDLTCGEISVLTAHRFQHRWMDKVLLVPVVGGADHFLEQTAQGGGRLTIPESVQEKGRGGTEMRFSGHGGDGLTVGLDDLSRLFQP